MTEKDLYADEPELVVTAVAGDDEVQDNAEGGAAAGEQAQARNLMQQGQC
ncbi:hypothetical protein SAVIM338S_00895 [Streptomyces avidinii]